MGSFGSRYGPEDGEDWQALCERARPRSCHTWAHGCPPTFGEAAMYRHRGSMEILWRRCLQGQRRKRIQKT
jgi:hypothetical protein